MEPHQRSTFDEMLVYPIGEKEPIYSIEYHDLATGPEKRYFIRSEYRTLVHGTTTHGMQEMNRERRDIARALLACNPSSALGVSFTLVAVSGVAMEAPGREPLTYYHRNGPVGAMFKAWRVGNFRKESPNTTVGCIGMGTASLTSYGLPSQKMVVFEIDTHVRRMVEPPTYFHYVDLARKQGVDVEFVMGDARISLERQDRKFGFLLVDAFSSDAIPAHLLTKQAFELYFQRLEDDGLLAVHTSNRYLDLEPVVERLCRELGLACRVMHGQSFNKTEDAAQEYGKFPSTWIAIARNKEALGIIEEDAQQWEKEDAAGRAPYYGRWRPLTRKDAVGLWTDDYSPMIPILRGEWRFWSRSSDD